MNGPSSDLASKLDRLLNVLLATALVLFIIRAIVE
jgi:hypothetical protein